MKILVRGTNWIGDAVMSIPALKALRRVFPDASISLHTRTWAEGIFGECDFIDELVTFDPHRWKAKDVFDNSRFLRADGYDLALLFPNSFESALTSIMSRIPRRIGYNKDVRGLLLTDPIPVPEWKNRRHEAYYYLNLVAEAEKRVLATEKALLVDEDTRVTVGPEVLKAGRERLESLGADPAKKWIGLGVGSTNSTAKRWPADHFGKLAALLASEDAEIFLMGSEADRPAARAVAASANIANIFDLTGMTTLSEAVAVLANLDLMISNDMGLAHVAPAVGVNTIVIFGPTNPVTTQPFSAKAIVLRKDVECSPCMLRKCPIDHRCMIWLTPEEVFEEAKVALEPRSNILDITSALPA